MSFVFLLAHWSDLQCPSVRIRLCPATHQLD